MSFSIEGDPSHQFRLCRPSIHALKHFSGSSSNTSYTVFSMLCHATRQYNIQQVAMHAKNDRLNQAGHSVYRMFRKTLVAAYSYIYGLPGSYGGSYWWSPPEQLLGDACTSASDIYSFGVVLWELCTGEQPVERNLRDIQIPQEAPQSISDLIVQCWNQDPAKRPTAVEMHALIRRDAY